MSKAVAITRDEHDALALRRLAVRSREADAARRRLAIALVLEVEGRPRAAAATACGMDRQTLRLDACVQRVLRYNAEGIAGLSDRVTGRGPQHRLQPEHEVALHELVQQGPSLETHGVVRWCRADLVAVIRQQFGVTVDVRTMGRALRRLGFSRMSVRPRHPKADAEAQEAHKKALPRWSPRRSPTPPAQSRPNSGGRTRPGSASRAR
jgi:transposase